MFVSGSMVGQKPHFSPTLVLSPLPLDVGKFPKNWCDVTKLREFDLGFNITDITTGQWVFVTSTLVSHGAIRVGRDRTYLADVLPQHKEPAPAISQLAYCRAALGRRLKVWRGENSRRGVSFYLLARNAQAAGVKWGTLLLNFRLLEFHGFKVRTVVCIYPFVFLSVQRTMTERLWRVQCFQCHIDVYSNLVRSWCRFLPVFCFGSVLSVYLCKALKFHETLMFVSLKIIPHNSVTSLVRLYFLSR